LPKGKADEILQEFGLKSSGKYGDEVAATQSGEDVSRLLEIRNRQQELLGDIREQEYEMQRRNEKNESLKETRISKYEADIRQNRNQAISIRDQAI